MESVSGHCVSQKSEGNLVVAGRLCPQLLSCFHFIMDVNLIRLLSALRDGFPLMVIYECLINAWRVAVTLTPAIWKHTFSQTPNAALLCTVP